MVSVVCGNGALQHPADSSGPNLVGFLQPDCIEQISFRLQHEKDLVEQARRAGIGVVHDDADVYKGFYPSLSLASATIDESSISVPWRTCTDAASI